VSGELLGVDVFGGCRDVDMTFGAIKAALDGATLDAVPLPDREHVLYVDDNGMVNGLAFNFPASMLCGRALFGPVVLAGKPDREGDDTPPTKRLRSAFTNMAHAWEAVMVDAARNGQIILPSANPETIPPPEIVALSDEEFMRWLMDT
jgi:hypothetical protein